MIVADKREKNLKEAWFNLLLKETHLDCQWQTRITELLLNLGLLADEDVDDELAVGVVSGLNGSESLEGGGERGVRQ